MADEKQKAVIDAPAVAVEAPKPDFHLVVVHPFADYRRGHPITDAEEIAAVMAGDNTHHCHKVFPQ